MDEGIEEISGCCCPFFGLHASHETGGIAFFGCHNNILNKMWKDTIFNLTSRGGGKLGIESDLGLEEDVNCHVPNFSSYTARAEGSKYTLVSSYRKKNKYDYRKIKANYLSGIRRSRFDLSHWRFVCNNRLEMFICFVNSNLSPIYITMVCCLC